MIRCKYIHGEPSLNRDSAVKLRIKNRTPLRWARARTRLRECPAIAGNILKEQGYISSDQYSVGSATPLR